jgi:copper chaperone NosL
MMRSDRLLFRLVGALAALLPACRAGDPPPAALDTKNEACRFCRMPVSDPRLAAQLAAPGEEPALFDDIGCLRDFLKQSGERPNGAVAYVADHRTGAWIRAARATYSRCPAVETPMGSHLIAHADAASRDTDAGARGCAVESATAVFGTGPPDGRKRGD